jgi:hypothetical protein
MTQFQTFRDVIDAWPTRREFADDIGVSVAVVHKMHENDAVRGVYFASIVLSSRRRHGPDHAITAWDLCRLAARRRSPAPRAEDAA